MKRRSLLVFMVAACLTSVIALRAQSTKEQPHGDSVRDCGECHTSERWNSVDKTKFRHDSTGFSLESAHAKTSCRSCHQSLVFNQVGTACVDCHKDAHRGELGFRCETCHSPKSWSNQSEMFRAHSRSRFPLFATHASLDCQACHLNQRPFEYANTPAQCGTCHVSTYNRTTNPNHAQAGFSRRCEDCHSVTSPEWESTPFSHPASFPLAGGHGGLACARCHSSGVFTGLSRDCYSCHQKDYVRTTNPNHQGGGFPTQCQNCHNINAWRPANFDHGTTRFPLTGAHLRTDCAKCHVGGKYAGTPSSCLACHQADYTKTTNPNHQAGGFPTSCENCHNTGAWRPANFDHGATRFPLTGAHQRIDCARCHAGGRYSGTPRDCVSCHQPDYNRTTNPNHAAGGFPTTCQSCHTTSAWKPASIDHNQTRFPLTGAHQRVDCARCHAGGRYSGTPRDCVSCHQPDYNRTTNPNHAAGGFPTACQNCHNTSAWKPANIDHNQTRFPLTGAHQRVDCARCHAGGRYTGTPTDCVSCHQADYNRTTNPNHAAGGFPTACLSCHNTSAWKPANIDHNRTRFPLTGAHQRVDCARCHVGGRYTGTPTDCVSCHQTDYSRTTSPNHQAAGFPTQCQTCHTTAAWKPSTFDHDGPYFPIYSGRHRGKWSSCSECHQNPANYKAFECILCHEHANKADLDGKHRSVSGYQYSSAACYRCHARGSVNSLGGARRLSR